MRQAGRALQRVLLAGECAKSLDELVVLLARLVLTAALVQSLKLIAQMQCRMNEKIITETRAESDEDETKKTL